MPIPCRLIGHDDRSTNLETWINTSMNFYCLRCGAMRESIDDEWIPYNKLPQKKEE